ncbi:MULTISPECIES: Crp/Fnr family transcriptional regulator [Streptomyces]|uniref:Crp/Fnr family transcriptional regulator n=1 Tax=Streptomyces TaxID=1883 RepID=UPI00067DB425|nr:MULTISPECIES: Crp/Fnr family transcriptional regulator [Streptomyces]
MLDHEVAVHAGHRARRARTAPAGGWADGTLLAELRKLEPGAPGPVQQALMRAGTARVHARGEIMIMTGGADTFVLLLLDGFAKVATTERSGVTALMDIRAAGDVVGESAAFDGRPRSATVTAAQQMLVRRIAQDEWLRWVGHSPVAGLAVSRSLAHRSRTAVRRHTRFAHGPVIARLASAVLDLAEQYGAAVPDGLLVRPGLTQAEWGELIGAQERRVHHMLHELARLGVLTFGRRRIVVRSLSALREIAATGRDTP